MRAIPIALILILLLPVALSAAPTMGVYFDGLATRQWAQPLLFEQFRGYVYGKEINCYLDAVEFALTVPSALVIMDYIVPLGSLTLGTLPQGISITYWPPLDTWDPGYNLLCTVEFLLLAPCWCPYGGPASDLILQIVPDPEVEGILGSCWPENHLFNFTGRYAVVCPSLMCMGTEEASWGSIKSLYR